MGLQKIKEKKEGKKKLLIPSEKQNRETRISFKSPQRLLIWKLILESGLLKKVTKKTRWYKNSYLRILQVSPKKFTHMF